MRHLISRKSGLNRPITTTKRQHTKKRFYGFSLLLPSAAHKLICQKPFFLHFYGMATWVDRGGQAKPDTNLLSSSPGGDKHKWSLPGGYHSSSSSSCPLNTGMDSTKELEFSLRLPVLNVVKRRIGIVYLSSTMADLFRRFPPPGFFLGSLSFLFLFSQIEQKKPAGIMPPEKKRRKEEGETPPSSSSSSSSPLSSPSWWHDENNIKTNWGSKDFRLFSPLLPPLPLLFDFKSLFLEIALRWEKEREREERGWGSHQFETKTSLINPPPPQSNFFFYQVWWCHLFLSKQQKLGGDVGRGKGGKPNFLLFEVPLSLSPWLQSSTKFRPVSLSLSSFSFSSILFSFCGRNASAVVTKQNFPRRERRFPFGLFYYACTHGSPSSFFLPIPGVKFASPPFLEGGHEYVFFSASPFVCVLFCSPDPPSFFQRGRKLAGGALLVTTFGRQAEKEEEEEEEEEESGEKLFARLLLLLFFFLFLFSRVFSCLGGEGFNTYL